MAPRKEETPVIIPDGHNGITVWSGGSSLSSRRSPSPPVPAAHAVGVAAAVTTARSLQAMQASDGEDDAPPILALPPELLTLVFARMQAVDVVSATGALPAWLELANRHVLLPRGHLALRPGASEGVATLLGARAHPTVHTLHLADLHDVSGALAALGAALPLDAVRTVWLQEGAHKADVDAVLKACPRVAALNLYNVPHSGLFVRVLIDSVLDPHVRTRCVFSARDHNARDVIAVLDEVGALLQEGVVTTLEPVRTVAHYAHYWQPAAALDLPYMADTRDLVLQAYGLGNNAFKDIARMPLLESLHVDNADGLQDDAMMAIVGSLTGLRKLSLHSARWLSASCWAAVFRSGALSRLQELRLSGCPQLDDGALGALVELPCLTRVELDLQDSPDFSRDGFELLFTCCPNLELVSLAVPYSRGAVDGVLLAPGLLARLRRLAVLVQGVDCGQEAEDGVKTLRKELRAACPARVQLDVTLTFLRLQMALSER